MTMLSVEAYPASSLSFRRTSAGRTGLHRLFAAAIVSDQFREKLLREPEAALANGYLGQPFALTDQEKTIIESVRANTLTDLAQKVNQALKNINVFECQENICIALTPYWATRWNCGSAVIKKIIAPAFTLFESFMEKPFERSPTSDQKLEAGLQAFSDLNMVLDENGVILEYKPGAFLLDGFPEISLNQRIQDIFSPELKEKFERVLHSVQQTGSARNLEYSQVISDREYWFDSRLVPTSNSQVLFTARDVTQCRETENRLMRQMQRLSALRSIDLAIASGLDLNLLLSMLLDQVTSLMRVDAVSILLLNSKTNMLEFTAGKGFYSNSLQHTHLKLGEGCAGRVAMERKMRHIPDLSQNPTDFNRSPQFHNEHFIAYYGVPLMAKGRVLGVLEIFHRSSLKPDVDWQDFLVMISGQAAIAIDSGLMFKEVQRSNLELNLAYDATIEGLSRALDLRDKRTEEHARRVTDTTIGLAVRLGVGGSDLVHLRRGAILHDIGKVAIPDEILFKPGPLAEDEWTIMRRHPAIAVDLLSPVTYLAPALDIPHWHHEKWNGTGYPDQLSGNQIPFSARLFALVDVYDALISDRPYRAAWSKGEAIQYIESQSGEHFDPKIVPEFLDLIRKSPVQ